MFFLTGVFCIIGTSQSSHGLGHTPCPLQPAPAHDLAFNPAFSEPSVHPIASSAACVCGKLCWVETADRSPVSMFHQQRCIVSKDSHGMNGSPLLKI